MIRKQCFLYSWMLAVGMLIMATRVVAQEPGVIGITATGKEVRPTRLEKPPWLKDVVEIADPSYPYHDRYVRNEGHGRYRLIFDVKSGAFTTVVIVKHSGHDSLDDAAVSAFRQWHVKPGTWRSLEIPVTWLISERGDYRRLNRYQDSAKQKKAR